MLRAPALTSPLRPARLSSLAGLRGARVRFAVVRFCDAFPATSDGDFVLRCSCGTEQRLGEMSIDVCGPLVLYDCVRCQSSMVGVIADDPFGRLLAPEPMTRRREQGGHRVEGYVVGSKVDVALRPPGADTDVLLIPATPNFFVQYRYV